VRNAIIFAVDVKPMQVGITRKSNRRQIIGLRRAATNW
jgi:hypothetical protein